MTKHSEVIDVICERHGASRTGFRKAFEARFVEEKIAEGEDDPKFLAEFAVESLRARHFLPDCYRVSTREEVDRPQLDLWEVVVTHRLKRRKIAMYRDLFCWLDFHDWFFNLYEVDHHGQETLIMGDDHPTPLLEQWVGAA